MGSYLVWLQSATSPLDVTKACKLNLSVYLIFKSMYEQLMLFFSLERRCGLRLLTVNVLNFTFASTHGPFESEAHIFRMVI